MKRKYAFIGLAAAAAAVCAVAYYLVFSAFNTQGGSSYLYIDADDSFDSVCAKLDTAAGTRQLAGLRLLAMATGYGDHVRTGRYDAGGGVSTLGLLRRLRNGSQTPVRLTIPNVRTMDRLAARLGAVLMADSAAWAHCFGDSATLAAFGTDTALLPCLFIPNTYEVYWDVTPRGLLGRMQRESEAYWIPERLALADSAGLTPDEVIVMASIVDQETANDAEKPMIAGMYLNRLHQGMKLQADPTVKFALKRFDLRRIYHDQLLTDSPYNTYRYEGLPPGPICIPALSSIEAVLHFARHDYVYMCAKEDFSGTHRFARTYAEHMQNAQRYAEALNRRGVR